MDIKSRSKKKHKGQALDIKKLVDLVQKEGKSLKEIEEQYGAKLKTLSHYRETHYANQRSLREKSELDVDEIKTQQVGKKSTKIQASMERVAGVAALLHDRITKKDGTIERSRILLDHIVTSLDSEGKSLFPDKNEHQKISDALHECVRRRNFVTCRRRSECARKR